MDIYEQLAETLFEQYVSTFPSAKNLADKASRVASNRGFIRTIYNRRARFNQWESAVWGVREPAISSKVEALRQWGKIRRAGTHKALNRLLQGSAADIMKLAMVQMKEQGVTDVLGPPLMTVHDELVWSIPFTKEGQEAAAEAGRIMCSCVELKVPLRIDDERGPSWGEVK